MRRIVFLDFDGVLNNSEWLFSSPPEPPQAALNPAAVALVNKICRDGQASVVLSTAWRMHYPQVELEGFLRSLGFTGAVVGRTPSLNVVSATNKARYAKYKTYVQRGFEVEAWLSRRDDIESFVILDDLDEFEQFTGRHILTDMDEGLVDRHVAVALDILNMPKWIALDCTEQVREVNRANGHHVPSTDD